MNKGITLLILVAVLAAMGLVFFMHTSQPDRRGGRIVAETGADAPLTVDPTNGPVSLPPNPLQAPQGDSGGLTSIAPPLTNRDGRPATVVLTPDGRVSTAGTGTSSQLPMFTPPPEAPKKPQTPPATEATQSAAAQTTPAFPAGTGRDKPSDGASAPATSTATQTPPNERPTTPPVGGANSQTSPGGSSGPTLTPWRVPAAETPVAEPAPKPASAVAEPVSPPAQVSAPSSTPAPKLSDKGTHTLKAMGVHFSGQNMILRIEAGDPFPCKTFVLTGPDRLVVDLPGTWKDMKAPTVPKNRLVKNVRIGKQTAGPRIVLDLAAPLKGHKIERNGNTVEVLVQ